MTSLKEMASYGLTLNVELRADYCTVQCTVYRCNVVVYTDTDLCNLTTVLRNLVKTSDYAVAAQLFVKFIHHPYHGFQ